MAWLYVPPACLPEMKPCSGSRSAPVPAGSNSACTSPVPDIELSVMSNGTLTPRPSSWRGWKTRPWRRLLSGTTLLPSTAAHGVMLWTSSLRATRANRSAWQASGRGQATPAISGPMSRASLANAHRPSSSSRTSPIISASAFPKSSEDWSAWATELRRASSRRRKSARPTSANGCSSLPSGRETRWPTPRACSGKRSSGGNRTELLRCWPTPMASDGNKPSAGNRKAADLTHASRMWPTPAARDAKGANSRAHVERNGTGRRHMDQLANFTVHSPLAPATPALGETTSATPRTLNPAFVEALMGWPEGWTAFGSVATAWSPWLRRMRFEFSRLNCAVKCEGPGP